MEDTLEFPGDERDFIDSFMSFHAFLKGFFGKRFLVFRHQGFLLSVE
jgi:hypothetical protein